MSLNPLRPGHGRSRSDVALLVTARVVRMFAYGVLAVILALYLADVGFTPAAIGLLFTLTLTGDAAISLGLTTWADRIGRRRTLTAGAALMVGAGLMFAVTHNWYVLVAAAVVGVISPTGNEIGPFLSIEQAALSETVGDARRTRIFAWSHLAGSLASAAGALFGGVVASGLQARGLSAVLAYRLLFISYAAAGALLGLMFLRLSPAVEVVPAATRPRRLGLHRSGGIVAQLSLLFALDAFAGGFVIQSLIAYWFRLRFGMNDAALGGLLFGVNVLAGVSALAAAWLARRIGLINTMVVTHLPSNILLCLVPLMPTLPLAVAVLLLRFSISQMDVPTRQSYTMAVVAPDERSAAAGVTTIARSLGAAAAPVLSGVLLTAWLAGPFVIAGGLKIIYDGLLYRGFRRRVAPEEARLFGGTREDE